MQIIKIKMVDIVPYENNVKLHPKQQIEQIKKSIVDFGNNDPIAVDENNVIIEGHGRYEALKELGYEEAECIVLTGLTEDQKNAYRLVHNKLTMNSDFDMKGLEEELKNIDIDLTAFDFDPFNMDEEEKEKEKEKEIIISLADRFIIPPLSVFDTKQGYWQDRKRMWKNMGIKSEEGRDGDLTFAKSFQTAHVYNKKRRYKKKKVVILVGRSLQNYVPI